MKDTDVKFMMNFIEQNSKGHDYIFKRIDQLSDKMDANQNMILQEISKLSELQANNRVEISRLDVRTGIIGTLTSSIVALAGYFFNKGV